jgi:hypothetical protein
MTSLAAEASAQLLRIGTMDDDAVTVVIPTIPPRADTLLPLAVSSALRQSHLPAAISIAVDRDHDGAWATRQRALDPVITPWVAFLDDDDEFYPQHLERLLGCAHKMVADYVFSYWDTSRSWDVLGHFGKVFDPSNPHHTTMTVLCRTELAQAVGFTPPAEGDIAGGEDWRFELGCVAAGARIVHLPEQSWYWRHHDRNTSGQPENW